MAQSEINYVKCGGFSSSNYQQTSGPATSKCHTQPAGYMSYPAKDNLAGVFNTNNALRIGLRENSQATC